MKKLKVGILFGGRSAEHEVSLQSAKNIIEAHDGRIWFESEENKGTTFYFTIPIRKQYGEFLTEEFY